MNFLNPVENPSGFVIFTIVLVVGIIALSFVARRKWQGGLMTGGMEGGIPATGIITGMGQTGLRVNDQPQLTFDVQVQPSTGGAPYAAKIKQTIPLMAMGMLAPGRQVALVISPKNPSKVKLDIQGTANLASIASMAAGHAPGGVAPAPGAQLSAPGSAAMAPPPGGGVQGQVRSNDQLVTSTDAVPATVVSVQETGQFYGPDPIVLLTLQLQTASGPRQIQAGYRVPADRRSRLMPGTVVRAHPDPANPNAAGIDWRAL